MKNKRKLIPVLVLMLSLITKTVYAFNTEIPDGHGWTGVWVKIRAATCETVGEEIMYCNYCDETVTRAIPALGHQLITIEEKEESCTKEGLEVTTCERCDYRSEKTLPATGHDWKIKSETKATETNEGEIISVCTYCGQENREVIQKLPSTTVPKQEQETVQPIEQILQPAEQTVEPTEQTVEPTEQTVEPAEQIVKPAQQNRITAIPSEVNALQKNEQDALQVVETPVVKQNKENKKIKPEKNAKEAAIPVLNTKKRQRINSMDVILNGAIGIVSIYSIYFLIQYVQVFLWIRRKRHEALLRMQKG